MGLAVASHQIAAAGAVLRQHEEQGLSEDELRAANTIADLDAEQTTCPACQGTIPGGVVRCPECGLRFQADPEPDGPSCH